MSEMYMRKRPAVFKGEVGLFPANELAEEDLKRLSPDRGTIVEATQPATADQRAFIWALAAKVADIVDGLHDKEDGMEWLCVRARHYRVIGHPIEGHVWYTRKSIRVSRAEMSRLIDRMIHVVVTDLIPDMPEGNLRRDIEAMAGIAPG